MLVAKAYQGAVVAKEGSDDLSMLRYREPDMLGFAT